MPRPNRILQLALITLCAGAWLQARAESSPVSFSAFYERNRHRPTPRGTVEQVYGRALKRNVVDKIRDGARQQVNTAAFVALSVVSRLKKLRTAAKLAGKGLVMALVGERAHDAGREHHERKRPVGDDVIEGAILACTMIPRVKTVMPKVFAAMACKSLYAGSKKLFQRYQLARGEVLAAAREGAIQVDPRLFESFRRDVDQIRGQHQARLDEAVARIREHRPLLARSNIRHKRGTSRWIRAKALAEKTWHRELVERGLATAREEKRELELIQQVARMMEQQGN